MKLDTFIGPHQSKRPDPNSKPEKIKIRKNNGKENHYETHENYRNRKSERRRW